MLSSSITAKDAINASFAFTLKNKQGETDSWYLDLKNKAEVGKGIGPQGKAADGEFSRPALLATGHHGHRVPWQAL